VTSAEHRVQLLRNALDTIDWLLHDSRHNHDPRIARRITPGEGIKRHVVDLARDALATDDRLRDGAPAHLHAVPTLTPTDDAS
jgi:hypothetical protein